MTAHLLLSNIYQYLLVSIGTYLLVSISTLLVLYDVRTVGYFVTINLMHRKAQSSTAIYIYITVVTVV